MTETPPLLHPAAAEAPGYLANHAARVFNRTVDAALRPHGLSLALIGPLLLLSWQGPLRQRDMVGASAIKQPAMVALLARLSDMGLIERRAHPGDGRAALVHLTDAGRRMADIGGAALLEANRIGLAGFDAADRDRLVTLLWRLIANLEDGTKHHD